MEPKILKLIIQPRVIDHLGIKMYQKPVDVISEFVANAWDADSEIVDIKLQNNTITIKDNGNGMTFDECQNYYLTVGRDRRIDTTRDLSIEKDRPILGRKGIGKFAGFGIAKSIIIDTISKETGEKTVFEMKINSIIEHDSRNEDEKPINVIEYLEPDVNRIDFHGTEVTLNEVNINDSNESINEFMDELSRRFLLTQFYTDFKILINEKILPESFSDSMEFVFPRDFTEDERTKYSNITSIDKNGWAIESFQDHIIHWRIGFYEETIKIEELRGISIFAKGKIAQKPFFFDLTGGISGQNALEYMTGQVRMDFIDEGNNDLISTERQRINLQSELGKEIRKWGIERIKVLSDIWKKRRSEKRLQELNDKIAGFRDRLDALPLTERKTVESVLKKIASFPKLGQKRFQEWCNDILTSWEKGRLKDLIIKISETEEITEQQFIDLLNEADILTALNIAESIKTKIVAIGSLKQRVKTKELENKVRDYIYEKPWIIHPKWESYRKERSVQNLLKDLGIIHLNSEPFNYRVDLALASGTNLLIVEFMRPGLEIDHNHLDRINDYVIEIKERLSSHTGGVITRLDAAYLIADNKKDTVLVKRKLEQLEKSENILFMTWDGLIQQALKQWEEYLELLKQRNPTDIRIQDL